MSNLFTLPHQPLALFYCPPRAGAMPVLIQAKPELEAMLANDLKADLTATAASSWALCLQSSADNMADLKQAEQLLQLWPHWHISRFNQYPLSQLISADSIPEKYVLLLLDCHASTLELAALLKEAQVFALSQQATLLIADDANGGHSQCQQRAKQLGIAELLNEASGKSPLIQFITEPCHHASLLANALAVFTVRSWLGFEALLWQKPVYCLGAPFYARLGLTHDLRLPPLQSTVSLSQLVQKVLLNGAICQHPLTCEGQHTVSALNWLALQLAQRRRFPVELYAIGFSLLWRKAVRQFFQGSRLHFVSRASQVPPGATALRWGFKPLDGIDATVSIIRIEDGFLRSVGLGALFARPLSWVADSQGLYFDATAPSDLEQILAQQVFSPALLLQAEQLITKLKHSGISKYNTGASAWQRPAGVAKVILVPGQVETDASIARGAADIKQNMALLQAVRAANSDAYIVYKPHPDVLAGARAAGENEHQALQYCDAQLLDVSMGQLLTQVDEVHVLTSLAGFEALIRGCKVHCYGMPFYAGWGLTQDRYGCHRRQRQLTLAELVAASLIQYPLYLCRHTGYYATAEQTLDDLVIWRQQLQQPTLTQKFSQLLQASAKRVLRWGISLIGGTK